MRLTRAGVAGACALLVWAHVVAAGQAPLEPPTQNHADRPGRSRLIDVPFLPQTEDLCGGAAVAMVMRYWGAQQIYPDDFAPLVDRGRAGIPTDVLVTDIARRGWRSVPFAGDAGAATEWMRRHIDQARPVIALIEVAPNRYHYVVVVAWTPDQVIVHDPARAPFRTFGHDEFAAAWRAAGRWAVLVVPGELSRATATTLPAPKVGPDTTTPGACGPYVDTLVAAARAGDVSGADAGLRAATSLCPGNAAVWRELAGLRFLQSRWAEAAALAEHASDLDPGDAPGWDLLATSRFLAGEPEGALAAWNRIDRPTVDVLRIEGAPRTRHPVIADVLDLPPRAVLTAAQYGRASRRLQALPSAAFARLRYTPSGNGLAQIEAAVVERPLVPRGAGPLVAVAARTALHRDLRLDIAAPTGSGELWTAAWRWWEHRPRVAFALATPSVAGLPGVTTVAGLWERASYATPSVESDARVVQQERRRASLGMADWTASWLRWNAGIALDRWDDDSHASVSAGLDVRAPGDRAALGAKAAVWAPVGSGRRFATAGIAVAMRTTVEPTRPRWSLVAGFDHASGAAPFDLWSGAGTGRARLPMLRAHPLLADGIVTGPVFGRRLAHTSVEYQRPVLKLTAAGVALAAFADVARAWNGRTTTGTTWHADAGVGMRVALPGNGGALRLDIARGLRDRRHVVSASWLPPWPGR